MARDDRPDPPRPPPPSPRDLRASLSSSIGLPRGRGAEHQTDPRGRAADAGQDPRGRGADPHGVGAPRRDDHGPSVAQVEPEPLEPRWSEEAPEPFERTPPPARSLEPRLSEPELPPEPPRAPPRSAAATRAPARTKATRPAKPRPTSEQRTSSGKTIVPPQAVAGSALVLVVAIMCFLACLAVGALSLVAEAAHDWQLDVSREITIQIKPIDGVAMDARLLKAMDLARATAGVRSARLIGEREGEALLEPWLGSGLDLSALPIPRLVVIELGDPATADIAGLKAAIARDIRGAVVDDHAVWAARLRTMASTMVVAGFGIVALMLAAMVLSVVFATRAAMAGNRDVIEVLHFVGAEDRFIARQFQRHFLVLGLQGGVVGGVAAMLCFLAADLATRARGDALSDQAHALFGGFAVGLTGHVGVLAVVAVVAVLTAVTSRATVLGQLGRLD